MLGSAGSGSFRAGPITVSVPATSANLGPGFDALGLALTLRDRMSAEVTGDSLFIDITGSGAETVPRDESHLVVRSMREAFDALGVRPVGLALTCDNVVPHGRGLGSSSAAIVAGVTLARALVVDGEALLDDAALFQLAAEIEGHPDNVAPAMFGGLTISGEQDGSYYTVAAPVDERIGAVAFVPPTPVETSFARGLLPATVAHEDAAANAGRAALLIAALGGQPEQLWRGTRDYLHQDYRSAAMPDSAHLVAALRADGIPAIISGAGPTVLAFVVANESSGVPLSGELMGRCPEGWSALALEVDRRGVMVE